MVWYSDNTTKVVISIQSAGGHTGNDFALDDIYEVGSLDQRSGTGKLVNLSGPRIFQGITCLTKYVPLPTVDILTMTSLKRNYYPLYQFAIFFMILSSLIIVYFFTTLNLWIFIVAIILSYVLILGSAKIIKLNNETLKIFSLNPFSLPHLIQINSIVKINSLQTFEHESDVAYGGSYFVLNRVYEIEYKTQTGNKKARFSIHDSRKEKEILSALKYTPQGN